MRNRQMRVALSALFAVSVCTVFAMAPEAPEIKYQTIPVEIVEVEEPKVEAPKVEVLPVELPKVEVPRVEELPEEPPEAVDPEVEEPDVWGMTEHELDIVQRVVMMEAGGESYTGQMAVAQCIRETAEATGMTPYEVVTQKGQYASPSNTATDSVMDAVQAVLYDGESAVGEPIRYFYAPDIVYSEWHETALEFVCEIGGHRFFKDKG